MRKCIQKRLGKPYHIIGDIPSGCRLYQPLSVFAPNDANGVTRHPEAHLLFRTDRNKIDKFLQLIYDVARDHIAIPPAWIKFNAPAHHNVRCDKFSYHKSPPFLRLTK